MTSTRTTVTEMQCPACHGTGTIKFEETPEQSAILDKLSDAGERRAAVSRKRNIAALTQLEAAFEEIRELAPQAAKLGVTREQIADAVGVSRGQLHNILTSNPSGRKLADAR